MADALADEFNAHVLKTKNFINEAAQGKLEQERGALQRYGDLLDRKTKGEWVAQALTRLIENLPADSIVVVDAVRKIEQVHAVRRAYGSRVVHVHLHADPQVLAERYRRKQRLKTFREFESYEQVSRKSTTGQRVGRLAESADVCISTDPCTREDVVVRAACRLGLYGREQQLAGNLPKALYESVRSFSAREFPVFDTREEAMDYLVS